MTSKDGVVHFGELDITKDAGGEPQDQQANIHTSDEYYKLEDTTPDGKRRAEQELEKKKRARQLNVPTDDAEVITWLRRAEQPAIMFGEERLDRRERLRIVLAELGVDVSVFAEEKEEPEKKTRDLNTTTWYYPGTASLEAARVFMAHYSIPRARTRLERLREEEKITTAQRMAKIQEIQKHTSKFNAIASQLADSRPIPYCEFSPSSDVLATCSWSGVCKLWSIPDCSLMRQYRGHHMNASCIRWHPMARSDSVRGQSDSELNLASCAVDGSVLLWSLKSDEPMASLKGHEPHRVPRLAFHPSGLYLATTSFDWPYSWRLWNLATSEEILYQEGHSLEVYCIEFHPDGSLACSGGLDAYGRLWDLRTGRCIMFLQGHTHGILSVDFHPDGYQLITASQDNTIKVWDIRQRKCIYTIPAHSQLVTSCKFEPDHGNYIATSSYDRTVKLWAHPAWAPLKTLSSHDNRVMHCDISPNRKYLASTSYDRKFTLFSTDEALS